MKREFVETKNRKEAEKKCPWASKIVKGEKMKIRLSDDYRIKGDFLEFFTHIGYEDGTANPIYDWVPSEYKIGVLAMLVSHEDVSPNTLIAKTGKPIFKLVFNRNDGIGGNSNPNIKRYHGWRGTTNDTSCYAHGLRKILGFKQLKNGMISVTLGLDLNPNEK